MHARPMTRSEEQCLLPQRAKAAVAVAALTLRLHMHRCPNRDKRDDHQYAERHPADREGGRDDGRMERREG